MFKKARDPLNTETHFYGIIFSIISFFILIIIGSIKQSNIKIVTSSIVFSISMLLLYTSSTIYHYSTKSEAIIKKLRKLDHAMIYVLISGSYTPFMIKFANSEKANLFLTVIWTITVIGIIAKIFWNSFPSILSTLIYIFLGWSIVFDIGIFSIMDINCIILLAIGGISYTIGGIIYGIKKPNCFKRLKYHEIFHLCVLLGSFFHFLAIAIYVI